MKKPVFKRKKVTKVHKKNKLYRLTGRLVAVAAAMCLLAGTVLTAYGEEKEKTDDGLSKKVVVTDILHRHIGSPDVSGGCYTDEIAHQHIGDEQNGGECFLTPVPHEHQGDAVSGGGCYGQAIPHIHQDSCYNTHDVHTDACFQSINCQEIHTQVVPYGTEERTCPTHGVTAFVVANSVLTHSACGAEPSATTVAYCQTCNTYQNTWHTVKKKICPYEEGDIEYDSPKCGKEGDDAVDGYKENCGFEPGDAESYLKTCEKTVDGYNLSCGLNADEPLGKLILTSETSQEGEKAHVTVKVENSSGRLVLSDTPFTWQDAGGNVIGNGDSIEVEENGNYSVSLSLVNKDVDESGLRSSILVDGIYKEESGPSPKPSQTPEASPTPSSGGGNDSKAEDKSDDEDGGEDDDDGDNDDGNNDSGGDDSSGTGDDGREDNGNPAVREAQNETPQEIPAESDLGDNAGISGRNGQKNAALSPTPSISPQKQFRVSKESGAVEARENAAAEKIPVQVQQAEKKNSIFNSPVVKMITITAGALLLLAGIALLLAYLRRSVKIYNDDGEGRMHYLGRCLVHNEEDVYFIAVSDTMVEKSYTNRYCIKPGLFRLGKQEDEELVVYKETKKATAPLSREMIVIL